jgi:hypothetical protein
MRPIVGARIMGMRRASTTAYGRESITAMNRRVNASKNHPNGTNPTLRTNHETPLPSPQRSQAQPPQFFCFRFCFIGHPATVAVLAKQPQFFCIRFVQAMPMRFTLGVRPSCFNSSVLDSELTKLRDELRRLLSGFNSSVLDSGVTGTVIIPTIPIQRLQFFCFRFCA